MRKAKVPLKTISPIEVRVVTEILTLTGRLGCLKYGLLDLSRRPPVTYYLTPIGGTVTNIQLLTSLRESLENYSSESISPLDMER